MNARQSYSSRRIFMKALGGGVLAGPLGGALPLLANVETSEMQLPEGSVRFRSEIEPLVQMLESTPREKVIEKSLAEIERGVSYRELLAALFLAGIRNVQPRPAVGFKFHSVLVVHSAHQASLGAMDSQRWYPLLWGIDYFKRAQATDVQEGDWTMARVDESKVPEARLARKQLIDALERWDVEAADWSAASATRTLSASQLLEVMSKYSVRDFRSIGHKAIYVAGAFRLLGVIGWEHAEPVIRSLAYAILNHTGEANPATTDVDADRAGRMNWELVNEVPDGWMYGRIDEGATVSLLEALRTQSPVEASKALVEQLRLGVHPQSLWDGLFVAAAELVSRQPTIVPLHAVTTMNATRYLYEQVSDSQLRCWILLQSASFIAHFRNAAGLGGDSQRQGLDRLNPAEGGVVGLGDIFENVRRDRPLGAEKTLRYLQDGGEPESIIRRARELVFLKGTDSHDFKFSSAAIEDFYGLSPRWRNVYLAGCTYLFRGESERTSTLAEKIILPS